MDPRILRDCNVLAFRDQITFPESVKRMTEAGVERYCADLVRLEKYFYGAEGQTHVEALPLIDPPPIARAFSGSALKKALRAIQAGRIDYAEFLRRIMKAGVVYYDVFMGGRRAIYTGRDGDFHVEKFPRPKRSNS